MKVKYTFLIILIMTIFNSCLNESKTERTKDIEALSRELNKRKNDSIKKYLKKYEYHKYWVLEKFSNEVSAEIEIYANKTDTILGQTKFYKKRKLDSSKSNFYEFQHYRTGKNFYEGKIIFHSELDHSISAKLKRKEYNLFIHPLDKWFNAVDNDTIEFQYESKTNDTILGLIYEIRQYETEEKNDERIRVVENLHLIDNKSFTNNPYIETYKEQYGKKREITMVHRQ